METPDVIVLCGGSGTRVADLLPRGCPKLLAPIFGRPYIDILAEKLRLAGTSRVILALGYGSDKIKDYVRGRRDLGLEFEFSQETQDGTHNAAGRAIAHVISDRFILMNGDTIYPGDAIPGIIKYHDETSLGTVVVVNSRGEDGGMMITRTRYHPGSIAYRCEFIDFGTPEIYGLFK